jgi:Ca-activated chloride channel family protein
VTKLELKYHLMTEYTSFVAVDKVIRETGEVVTVKQPLPLPEVVSDYAVGGVCFSASVKRTRKGVTTKYLQEDRVVLEPKELPCRVYITGGVVPSGITLDKVEEIIFSQIKKELENIFKKWELKSLTIVLKVEGGKIKTIKTKKYKGKKCKEEELEKVFKKLRFPTSFKGSIELKLEYI